MRYNCAGTHTGLRWIMLIIFCKYVRAPKRRLVLLILFYLRERKKRVREAMAGWVFECLHLSLVGKGRRLRVLTGSFAAANKGHACKPRPQLPPRAAPFCAALSRGWPAGRRLEMLLRNTQSVYMRARKGVQTGKSAFFAELKSVGFCSGWLPENCLLALILWSKNLFAFLCTTMCSIISANLLVGLIPSQFQKFRLLVICQRN